MKLGELKWSPGQLVELKNVLILKDGRKELVRGELLFRDGILCDAEKVFFDEKRLPDIIIDFDADGGDDDHNCVVASPGLIDLQINGAYGCDFTGVTDDENRVAEALVHVSENLPRHGVTAYCPTIVTTHNEVYDSILKKFNSAMIENNRGATRSRVLGAHLEGPFIRYV